MKRKDKIISFALLIAVMFGISLAGNFLVVPDVEPAVIGPPVEQHQLALVAALDAAGPNENNITEADGTPVDGYGDDLFAGNRFSYTICINASDGDAAADIDVISASLTDGTTGANVTTFIWTTATGLVTESTGAANVVLGSFSNVTGANDIDIMIPFTIEWDFGDYTDLDVNITLDEAGTPVATVLNNLNLDVIATLTASDSTMFTYPDYLTGAAFGAIECTYHYTTQVALFPLDAETDFHVSRAAVLAEGIGVDTDVSTAYAEGTGVAQFDNLIAPDVNERIELTFTLIAVDNGDGASGTNLMAVTTTDTVWVDPTAGHTGEPPDDGWIIPNIFDSPEGVMLIGGIAVVAGAGTYYFYGRNRTTSTRRKTKRRKPAKKKTKRKRKRSK